MAKIHEISPDKLTFKRLFEVYTENYKIELSEASVARIVTCREYLDNKMKTQEKPIYGITTGFGSLCNSVISHEQLGDLQKNLVMSHACGMGEEVSQDIVKLMLFLKAQSLSYGNSGVQLVTVQRLLDFYNNDVLPVVYQQGSLGASGDLSPLANMSLPLLGLGEVYYKGQKTAAAEVLKVFGWEPIELQSKEGLALLNGTQFMLSFGIYTMFKTIRLSMLADIIGAVSLEGFDGRIEPFYLPLHEIRNHRGQIVTAKRFLELLDGSEIINREKNHVQDPYSFRCIPQVHGACKDAICYVANVLSEEMNAVTDNPTIFPDDDVIVSGGNFHGEPLALALDFLAIALSELGSISERRVYKLISGQRGLPSFLVANPGLNSGFMIPQYCAASIASQNKQLCTPASVDSIDSSQGQEDHVSMGANAATKVYRVMMNLERILGIELFNATQALEFRRPLRSSAVIENFVAGFRKNVDFVNNDKVMYVEMQKSVDYVRSAELNFVDYLPEGI